ncbi:GNAT family N-acetyltransferase [Clostridium septicum]|uniref:GNAT family N-acetyltransferase n=1 Tax=Clostridium septicum TaxID=1504 RepID=UPI0032162AD1
MKYYNTNIENFVLRETSVEDIQIILSLIKDIAEYENMLDQVIATEDSLRESIFENNRAKVLLGELDGKVVGYALYFYNFSTFVGREGLYLEDIFINPKVRGKGLGKEIFKVLGKIAKKNGCKRMEWVCLDWNKPSINFYKSLGSKAMDEWTIYRLTDNEIEKLSRA